MDAHVTLDVGGGDAAGCAGDPEIFAEIRSGNRAAGGVDLDGTIDVLDANGTGSGVDLDGAVDFADIDGTGGDGGVDLGEVGDFNDVVDGNVAEAVEVLADADGVGSLFDGRMGDDFVEDLTGVLKEPAAGVDFGMNLDLIGIATGDADVPGSVREIEANGTADGESAVENAVSGGSDATTGELDGCGKSGDKKAAAEKHFSSEGSACGVQG